jgi:hypothetical protein
VPLLPAVKLGTLKGNLTDGISITVGAKGILSGSLTLFVADGWVRLGFGLDIFGKNYSADIKVIPLSF